MTISIAELSPVLHDLFHDAADRLAAESGFAARRSPLTGGVFARTLVFGLLEKPASSLQDFADFAAERLDADVSHSAFARRFTPASSVFLKDLLAAALDRCFTARPAVLPVLRRFKGVYLRDGTVVALPASLAAFFPGRTAKGGVPTAALKVVLEVELTTGLFTEAEVVAATDNDKTAEVSAKPLPRGSLLLEDMGFLAADRLKSYMAQGVFFLTRVPAWTAFFEKRRGRGHRRVDIVGWLREAKGWYPEREVVVFHDGKLPLRLIAARVPDEVAEERRRRVLEDAKGRGRAPSAKKLALCEWNVLVTNAPPEKISAREGWEVRRVRWQIELVFRVFKSEGGLEKTRARTRERALTELFARLLGLLVARWALSAAGYRPMRHAGQPAMRALKALAAALLGALRSARKLGKVVRDLARRLGRCKIQKRRKRDSTLDRLYALDPEFRDIEKAA